MVIFKVVENFALEIEKDTIFLHEDEEYKFKTLYFDIEATQEMVVIEKVLANSGRALNLVVPKRIGWILEEN